MAHIAIWCLQTQLYNKRNYRRLRIPCVYRSVTCLYEKQLRLSDNKDYQAKDPLRKALIYARVGNYIDFGAMKHVDTNQFLALLAKEDNDNLDDDTYARFLERLSQAKTLLLLCDNCGEVVLDKLFLEQVKLAFPDLEIYAMVRGGDVLNDVAMPDALEAGLDRVATLVSSGKPIAGTMPEYLDPEAKRVLDQADVILAKGMANYESFSGRGYRAFYAFLCKCELFTERFQVPLLTGMFIEEQNFISYCSHVRQ